VPLAAPEIETVPVESPVKLIVPDAVPEIPPPPATTGDQIATRPP
jgi:hypothetical protein